MSAASPQSGEMYIDTWPKSTPSLRRSEIWLSETRRFAPNGARMKFLTVVAYKPLAPNGAKPSSSKNTDRFVARVLERRHWNCRLGTPADFHKQLNSKWSQAARRSFIAVAGSSPTRRLFFLEDRIALIASRERLKIDFRFWKITLNQARLFI